MVDRVVALEARIDHRFRDGGLLATTLEAVPGAIYLESGLPAVREVVARLATA